MLKITPDPPAPFLFIPTDSITDTPESLLETLATLSGAYFATMDFPSDAMTAALTRAEALTTVLQFQLREREELLTENELATLAWSIEGHIREARIIMAMWQAGRSQRRNCT